MIKLPLLQHKSSSCTERILYGSNVNRTWSVNNTVAIINLTCNKCMHHCLCCIFCERPAHYPHLPDKCWMWGAKVNLLSSKTLRHMASVGIWMSVPPIVIFWHWTLDSWREAPSQMNCILYLLSFQLLALIHWLVSSTHVTNCRTLTPVSTGSARKYSWLSSAYKCTPSAWRRAMAMTSAQWIRKSINPTTLPWGTPVCQNWTGRQLSSST